MRSKTQHVNTESDAAPAVADAMNAVIRAGVEDVVDSARDGWKVGLQTGMVGARQSTLRFINVEAPPGTLGIGFSDAKGTRLGETAGGVRIATLDPTSPLSSSVCIGWHLVAIDGRPVSKSHVETADRLRARADCSRLLRFATERGTVVFVRQFLAVGLPPMLLVAMLTVIHAIMSRYKL